MAEARFSVARNTFLGRNFRPLNMREGLALARETAGEHPEAAWLVSLFPSGPPDTLGQARDVFLSVSSHPWGLTYAACLGASGGTQLLARAAHLGFPFATGEYSARLFGRDRMEWAERGASLGDAAAMCILAQCLAEGSGGEKNLRLAKTWWRKSAQLGDVSALAAVAKCDFSATEPKRYYYLCAAARGGHYSAPFDIVWAAERFSSDSRILFEIGSGTCGNVNPELRTVFSRRFSTVSGVQKAEFIYRQGCELARECICTWLMIARQMHINRDMRKMIGKIIWQQRSSWAHLIQTDLKSQS